jgi:hypothetical protein
MKWFLKRLGLEDELMEVRLAAIGKFKTLLCACVSVRMDGYDCWMLFQSQFVVLVKNSMNLQKVLSNFSLVCFLSLPFFVTHSYTLFLLERMTKFGEER